MSYERIIALDVGTKRIGVALTDPLMITAQPLKVVNRTSDDAAVNEINDICSQNNVILLVVGLPKNMNGTIGPQAESTQAFAELLKEKTGLDVAFEDERLTSRQAERVLSEQNKKYTRNKGLVDVTSAVIILQQHLSRRSLS